MICGWATATIVMSTRIMKKPTQSAISAIHGQVVIAPCVPGEPFVIGLKYFR